MIATPTAPEETSWSLKKREKGAWEGEWNGVELPIRPI